MITTTAAAAAAATATAVEVAGAAMESEEEAAATLALATATAMRAKMKTWVNFLQLRCNTYAKEGDLCFTRGDLQNAVMWYSRALCEGYALDIVR